MASLIGRRIGNFEITEPIGAGAMGAVYRARHVTLGHDVAVKVMKAPLATSPAHRETSVQRFIAEARAIAALKDNPHVIKLYDFGELDDGAFYYVMEHLDGHDLERELQRRGRLSVAQALPYLRQICDGLQAAHDRQIVHRDLKPANIFVASIAPLRIKLLDFGLSKRLDSDLGLSVSGAGMGTPLFAAPEQVLGEPERIGPPTDVYALGVITYLMLSARLPFDVPAEASPLSLIKLPLDQPAVPLHRRKATVPPAVAEVVDRCLAREPAERPPSPMAFLRELERAARAAGCAEDLGLEAVNTAPTDSVDETLPLQSGQGPPPPVSSPGPARPSSMARPPSSLPVEAHEVGSSARPVWTRGPGRTVAIGVGLGLALLLLLVGMLWWGGKEDAPGVGSGGPARPAAVVDAGGPPGVAMPPAAVDAGVAAAADLTVDATALTLSTDAALRRVDARARARRRRKTRRLGRRRGRARTRRRPARRPRERVKDTIRDPFRDD